MTSLQKVVLGTPPTAVDGDTVRVANTKANANVDVLNAQAALTSAAGITAAQALTVAHIGKRINIALASAGVVNLPAASTCAADNVLLLRNIGTTVVTLAITAGSGDTVALSKLNPGESALMDTDGVHAWTVLMRGRSNSDNEVVNGNCTVNGNETVGGTLGVTGNATVAGTLGVTGQAAFSLRPTFAAKTPWDTGNLPVPVTSSNNAITLTWVGGTTGVSYKIDATSIGNLIDSASAQTISAVKTFTGVGTAGTYTSSPISINSGAAGAACLGFVSNNVNSGGVFRLNSVSVFEFVNYNATAYSAITCASVTQTSDQAIKKDVATLTNVMSRLRTKRGVSYTLKSDNTKQLGVIAQDWVEDFPELISHGMDIDEDGDGIAHQYDSDTGQEIFGPSGKPQGRPLLGFKYTNAVGLLLQGLIETDEALQAALARIAALEAKQ